MKSFELVWVFKDNMQVYSNSTSNLCYWITLPIACPKCNREWQAVSAVGAEGIECPFCGNIDPFYVWSIPKNAIDKRMLQ